MPPNAPVTCSARAASSATRCDAIPSSSTRSTTTTTLAVEATRAELVADALDTLEWRGDQEQRREGLRRFKRRELLRIATRDLLGYARLEATERELTGLAEACLEAALVALRPPLPFAVIGMGRLGGGELSYASDIDVLFVYDGDSADDFNHAEHVAAQLVQEIGATTAEGQTFRIDARLRPEGNQGPLARSIGGFRQYYEQWGLTWERQALTKARFVAGDADAGCALRRARRPSSRYGRPMTDDDVREIRRMKARIERERIPPGEDPQFHLKLGRGSLSDVEFTVQLLQLVHGGEHPDVRVPGTIDALAATATHASCSTPTTPRCSRRRTASASGRATRTTCRPRTPPTRSPATRPSSNVSRCSSATSTARTACCATTTAASPDAPGASSNASSTTPDDHVGGDLEAVGGARCASRWRVIPFVVSAIALIVRVGDDYRPSADQAWIELQIRDIGHHPVLLGPYSRFGWFHPGPLLYYLLWLPYRHHRQHRREPGHRRAHPERGRRRRHRAGRPPTGWAPARAPDAVPRRAPESPAEGAQFFRDVWNPLITVLPFVLLVLVAWSMSCAEAWALPVGVAVATFLVQTHVGYGLVATALAARGRRRCGDHRVATTVRWSPCDRVRSWLRMLVVTVGVGAVLWLPVVVQQVRDEPGNLGTLVRFFRDHGREHSYGDAWHVVAAQLSVVARLGARQRRPQHLQRRARPERRRRRSRCGHSCSSSPACSRGDGRRTPSGSTCVVALTIVVAVVSVSRIVGDIFPYLVTWTWAVGMLTWLAIAWSVVRWWQTRGASDPRVGQVALGVVAVGLVVVSIVNTVDAATAGNPDPIGSRQVEGLVAKIRDALPSGDGVVEIRGGTTPGSAWVGAGIAAQLERDGIDTRVSPDLGFAYGPDRVLGDEQVRLVVLPVEQPDLAATRELPCFEDAGRVEKFTLFLGDPECINRG